MNIEASFPDQPDWPVQNTKVEFLVEKQKELEEFTVNKEAETQENDQEEIIEEIQEAFSVKVEEENTEANTAEFSHQWIGKEFTEIDDSQPYAKVRSVSSYGVVKIDFSKKMYIPDYSQFREKRLLNEEEIEVADGLNSLSDEEYFWL